jgi:hypothetical protein
MKRLKHYDQIEVFSYVGTWLVTASLIALLAGTASAMFLLSLDNATTWRESHSWMIWLLPLLVSWSDWFTAGMASLSMPAII